MGFSGTVALAATAIITSQAQLPFRPERVVIPDTVGANFLINDLRIGVKSQFVGTGAIPALTFAQNAIDTTLGLDTACISQQISFSVTNTDGAAAHLFAASLIGTTMDNLAAPNGSEEKNPSCSRPVSYFARFRERVTFASLTKFCKSC